MRSCAIRGKLTEVVVRGFIFDAIRRRVLNDRALSGGMVTTAVKNPYTPTPKTSQTEVKDSS